MLCHHYNKAHEQADDCRNCKQTQSLSEGTSVMEKLLSGRTKNQKVTQQNQNQNVYHGQISQLILSVQAKVGQPWCWEHSTGIISNNSTVIYACRSISFAFSTICLIKVSQKMVRDWLTKLRGSSIGKSGTAAFQRRYKTLLDPKKCQMSTMSWCYNQGKSVLAGNVCRVAE